MIATLRNDGTYALGDAHGDFIEPEALGWAAADPEKEFRDEAARGRDAKMRGPAERARVCPACGELFTTHRLNVKRCDRCRKEAPKGEAEAQRRRREKARKGDVFALYKGDTLLDMGTAEELAQRTGVKPSSIEYKATPSYHARRGDNAVKAYRIGVK